MKFICEKRDGEIWVRGKCCMDRKTGKFREDYSGWIVKDIEIPTSSVLCDDEGRLIWQVIGDKVAPGISPLTEKEQAAKDKPTVAEEIELLKVEIEKLKERSEDN